MAIENCLLSKAAPRKQPAGEVFSVSVASEVEREEIYRVRHEVYARELGQHPENAARLLRDSLDDGNVYIVAKVAGEMAGFVSVTPPGQPGYSIEKYFDRETLPFTVDDGLYEIRLLTVLRTHRGGE